MHDPHSRPRLDELALLFTGSPLPATFKTSNTESTVEEEDGLRTPQEDESNPMHSTPDAHAEVPAPPVRPAGSKTTGTPTMVQNPQIHPSLLDRHSDVAEAHPLFAIAQLGVDRRLIVNRKRQLKMYRVWMQGKFRKL